MGDYEDLIEQINAHCVGHPHAKIAWPHRLLHDCRDAIATLTRELAEAKAECEGVASEAAKMLTEYLETRDAAIARAEAAENELADWLKAEAEFNAVRVKKEMSLRALLREAELVIQLLLNTPEIADCDPRDKDTETQIAERKARNISARITAATQTETGGEDE